MWIRKTFEERSAEKRAAIIRNFFYLIVFYAVASFLTICAGRLLGRQVSNQAAAVDGAILTVLILGLVSLLGAERRRSLRHTVVCERCNCVKSSDGENKCTCGGNYFSLSEMKWSSPSVDQPPSGFQRAALQGVS